MGCMEWSEGSGAVESVTCVLTVHCPCSMLTSALHVASHLLLPATHSLLVTSALAQPEWARRSSGRGYLLLFVVGE